MKPQREHGLCHATTQSDAPQQLPKARDECKTYRVWADMRARCRNPRWWLYKYYGARGITVCERWNTSFANFFADMGRRPPGMQLDRIDNSKGYSPENCRWASRAEQQRNTRATRHIEYQGRTQCLADWAKEAGMAPNALGSRLKLGWTMERAMTEPVRKHTFKGRRAA